MYNQHVGNLEQVKFEETPKGMFGTVFIKFQTKAFFKVRLRRTRMWSLWEFREKNVPKNGLWAHYFHCRYCGWERVKVTICRYCDKPMDEIGSPGQLVGKVQGIDVFKLRPELVAQAQSGVAPALKKVGKHKGIDVFEFTPEKLVR